MTVLHLGHQPADVSGITAGQISTDAAGFDADLDVNAIEFTGGRESSSPFSVAFGAPSGDLWFQFRFVAPNTVGSPEFSDDQSFLEFRSQTDGVVAELFTKNNDAGIYARAIGDSTVDAGGSLTKGGATVHWINVKISVGADITIELYDGASLMSSATASNSGGKTAPRLAVFMNSNMHNDFSSGPFSWYYAHIAVLDGASTIGRKFARQTVNTVGNYDQWGGTLSALSDGEIATRMTSDTAGQRQNATVTGPTGPSGASMAAVHIKAIAQAGTSGPASLAGSVRIGTTDYDVSAVSLSSDVPEQTIFSWTTNPSDSSTWTDATLPDEIGLLSAT